VAEKGIPDIIGYTKNANPCFIEVKFQETLETKRKLCFAVHISKEQKDWLLTTHRMGCRAGVAFTVDDAIGIITNNWEYHPRHPRTFCFLPKEEQLEMKKKYLEFKAAKTLREKDPTTRYRDLDKQGLR